MKTVAMETVTWDEVPETKRNRQVLKVIYLELVVLFRGLQNLNKTEEA